jgi:hypothetical protein
MMASHGLDEGNGRGPCQTSRGGPGACGWGGRAIRTPGGASALVVQSQRLQTTRNYADALMPTLPVHVIIVASPRLAPQLKPDKMSSSLAGALVPPDEPADVDMHSSSFDDATPDTAADLYPKQEEEMGDLFGEDSNVDFVHHSRLVLH